jgi:excinuclease ABC subunit A
VLDEPSVGLHPADTGRLVSSLQRLRDAGNTVIVVEHDAALIRAADHVIDIGPGPGELGGRVVVSGTPVDIARHPDSPTARYLRGELTIGRRSRRDQKRTTDLVLVGACLHNLRDVTVRFPHGLLTCVTGPSGSGKSSLVIDVLQRAVGTAIETGEPPPGPFRSLHGYEPFSRAVSAEQDPMSRNRRSIPATYVGIFDDIRRIFAGQPESVRRGWTAAHFSFNSEAGQCLACRGAGEQIMELHFLPDIRVRCPKCHGRRFNDEVLTVELEGQSIADVLDMDVTTARQFFGASPLIAGVLRNLDDIGLGYLRLGQGAVTLSCGEAQRLKLARELCQTDAGKPSLCILDEPTTGLHAVDVAVLVLFLHRLVDMGHTVIVIEHNVDVVASADWVIDMGPGAGAEGGTIVKAGTPDDIAGHERSALAPFLAPVLARQRRCRQEVAPSDWPGPASLRPRVSPGPADAPAPPGRLVGRAGRQTTQPLPTSDQAHTQPRPHRM